MTHVANLQDHMAYSCQCGCVDFNLLKSGNIECVLCGKKITDSAWGLMVEINQKPVAWRWGVPKLKHGTFEWRYSVNKTKPDAIPLYTTPPQQEAKDEIDWKDMYEKQKRHSEMWAAKYEKDIGPLEKAVPHQEAMDGCQCPACKVAPHASDCAVHNEPAYPVGECNCEAKDEPVAGQPLPCPFCGHVGLNFADGETYRWGVASCGGCGASCGDIRREYPDLGEWHTEAIAEWNRRSPAPQRTWVGLTDEHKEGLIYMTDPNPEPHHLRELIDVVEYELRSKNT